MACDLSPVMVYFGFPERRFKIWSAPVTRMNITSISYKNCTVVGAAGPLDRTTAPQLEAALGALDREGVLRVVIDLSGVSDMSSAGLRVIISAAKRFRRRDGGDLCLAAPSKRVVEVLDLAGLLPVLCVFDTQEEAVASFEVR